MVQLTAAFVLGCIIGQERLLDRLQENDEQ
jgi:uncharacterized membrane protein YhiD involved in acid resistance